MIVHVITNSQSINFCLLPEDMEEWLNRLGRIPFPVEYCKKLFEEEDIDTEFESYCSFLNKEIKNALISNDYEILLVLYNSLGFYKFGSLIEFIDYCNKSEIKLNMERYDVSEGI